MTEHESTGAQQQRISPIRKYGYVAEIMKSTAGEITIFHYVIQLENSTGIVHWGQELSEQRALESVHDFLEQCARREA